MKTFKLMLFTLVMAMMAQKTFAAEPVIGLYLTQHDYLSHTLSYTTDGTLKNTVQLNSYFGSSTIAVVHDGKRQLFSKKEVFGYRIDSLDYRYFNALPFHILESKDIYIYTRSQLIQEGKGPKSVERFYFSATAASPVLALTIENIQRVYARNRKFTNAVESLFSSDSKLAIFDNANHEYRIAYLYAENK